MPKKKKDTKKDIRRKKDDIRLEKKMKELEDLKKKYRNQNILAFIGILILVPLEFLALYADAWLIFVMAMLGVIGLIAKITFNMKKVGIIEKQIDDELKGTLKPKF